jgi:hypothetical protein
MEERFFTDEQLREMERRTVDRLTDAIDAGEPEHRQTHVQRISLNARFVSKLDHRDLE